MHEAEDCAQQGRLARTVGAENADELVVRDRKGDAGEDGAATQRQRHIGEFDGFHDPLLDNASSSAFS
jgi:hypothetical protein